MKKIKPDEIYHHLSGFLKSRGIELTEGSYSQTIQKSCGVVSDVINLTQTSLHRAKGEMEKALDHARQVIHEKTAPPTPGSVPPKVKATAPKARSAAPPKPAAKGGAGTNKKKAGSPKAGRPKK